MNKRFLTVVMLALLALGLGCSKNDDGDGESGSAAPPAKPANGSPVAAEFVELKDGKRGRVLVVKLYNFGPQTATGYVLLAKYFDKDGKALKVKPGTAFEKDHDFTSMSGGRYAASAQTWTTLEIDMLAIPDQATKAEVVISKVMGEGGKDWWSQDSWNDWPSGDPGRSGDQK